MQVSRLISFSKTNNVSKRSFSSSSKGVKVTVLGAAGGIGQPLSLLLKQNNNITHLSLFDLINTPGVSIDLSHINTPSKVTGHVGDAELRTALDGSNVVVIPAGVPRKPGMTRDDLFNTNASIVKKLAEAIAKSAPKANILVISNPVNSTVPIVAETLKLAGVYDKGRLFGVTTLDIVRANTFVSQVKGLDMSTTKITVVGGHAGITIIPLLSQIPGVTFEKDQLETLTKRIQFGGDEVVQAKAGLGSATLSMAYAGAYFTNRLIEALGGKTGIIEPSYVESSIVPGASFFSSNIELGPDGIKTIHPLGKLSPFEEKLLAAAIPELAQSIKKGIDFVKATA